MYETEANHRTEPNSEIPPEVMQEFGELKGRVIARSVLPWSEHCTECVWPSCYATCDMYSPREDGRCRRFANGMVRVECASAINSYLLKIQFKRWGKLWSPASIRIHANAIADRIEKKDYFIGTALYELPLPSRIKTFVTSKRYGLKKREAGKPAKRDQMPTSFVLECYNPGTFSVQLSLTLRSVDESVRIPFQKLIDLLPGFHRIRIPIGEITKVFDVLRPFNIEIVPGDSEHQVSLYFGLMDFIQEKGQKAAPSKGVKCIVWDLDNTLWDGILIEDGMDGVRLKPGVVDVIRELDGRGILHSIASKNTFNEAMQALKGLGCDEFFLAPKISWSPKSEGLRAIAQELNISLDSILFVDDSEFEREEVRSGCPEVRVIDAVRYRTLIEMEECKVPVTSESKERRKMYQVEAARKDVAADFADDYMAFLRHCQIQLRIQPMTQENLERVHELTQRTNQMNFSGNRYSREVLEGILRSSHMNTYVLTCEDRFGSYGIVGVCIVDNREPRMTDLMFSCRVQAKRVEHAFVGYIVRKFIRESGKDFFVNYRKTPRNAPAGKVFDDLEAIELEVSNGVTHFVFPKDKSVPDDAVISIVEQEFPIGVTGTRS